MAFLDLAEGLLEEFSQWAPVARDNARWTDLHVFRDDAKRQLWIDAQCERARRARATGRLAKIASRPPCPHCGAPVERDSANRRAKVPTYCSRKCMRASVWARWHAKHGAERNARRRAA